MITTVYNMRFGEMSGDARTKKRCIFANSVARGRFGEPCHLAKPLLRCRQCAGDSAAGQ